MTKLYAYAGIILLIALLVFPCAYALPTTGAATGVTSKNLTFHATGAAGNTWWEYGTRSGSLVWKTDNVTPAAGVASKVESGLPLFSNTLYYFRACDSSGCGAQLSATLAQVTPNPTTTYGRTARNITSSRIDVAVVAGSLPEPYMWTPGGIKLELVIGVLLFFVFTGLWIRQRETIIPIVVGFLCSGSLIYAGTNSVGIPPEFTILATVIAAIAITGIVTGLFKR